MKGVAELIWWVLFLPLIGSIIQAFLGGPIVKALGPQLGKRVMGGIATLVIAIAFGIGLTITLALYKDHGHAEILTLFPWIKILGLNVPFEVVIDPLSMMMVLIITGIGALIHLYATGYMAAEREYTRFFTYLNLFISAMLILVLGNNLALMFIGWEGVGLCSYLLIGFWYKDLINAKAANKAFIVNRIGDWGLTLGMFGLAVLLMSNPVEGANGRWLSYDVLYKYGSELFNSSPQFTTAVAILLFVGACGKSAQFPLYFWLPDAMAGPTPVSALIHAATMVTAGVFMMNRLNIVYQNSADASAVVCGVGAFTAVFAALIAFGQTDIKKVLAYSTVSQLGFMFIGCGAGLYWTGMFHVTTHAFFKALLFLGSGAVIHAMSHEQDMRHYGNLRKYLPITFGTMFLGYLSIAGIYGFAGFYSKESILGGALSNSHAMLGAQVNVGYVAGFIGLFAAALTAAYMTRMTWMTFWGKEERWRAIPAVAHDGHGHHEAHDEAHHGAGDEGHEHDLAAHETHEDPHGFFYSDAEMLARAEVAEHHHHLDAEHKPREVPPSMWIPLVVLAVPSVIGGYLLEKDHFLQHWLESNEGKRLGEMHLHPEGLNLVLLSSIAAVGGIVVALVYYLLLNRNLLPKSEGWNMAAWNPFQRAARNQFGYDDAVVNAGVDGGGEMATTIWKRFDVGVVDGFVNGLGVGVRTIGKVFSSIQTGFVRSYALVMLIGGAIVIGMLVARSGPDPNRLPVPPPVMPTDGGQH